MKIKPIALAVCMFLAHMQPIMAQESKAKDSLDTFSLDTIVVSATRTSSAVLDVPASVTVITSKEIENKNVTKVEELFKNEPGILYDSVAETIQMRGRSSDDVLVLVDGVPSFSPFNNDANLDSIPIDNIERIEIVRGSASSLYGGNAVAGIINIVTKNPDKNSVTVRLQGGSQNTWRKDISVSQKISDKFGVSLGWESKNSDGYMQRYARVASSSATSSGPIGTGSIKPMPDGKGGTQYMVGERGLRGYDKDNYWLKMKYDFDKDKNLTYSLSYYKYEGKTTGAKSYVTDASGNPIFKGSVQLPDGRWVKFTEGNFTDYLNRKEVLTHGFQYKDTKNNIAFNLGLSDVIDAGYNSGSLLDKNTSGSMAQYPGKTYNMDFQKVWENIGKHTMVAGFTLRQDEMQYKNWNLAHWGDSNSKTSLNYDSGGKDFSSAVFFQDEYAVSKKFKIFSGLRFDRYSMSDGYSNWNTGTTANILYPNNTYNQLSPKLSLEYKPDDKTSYYASYGHSFRPPELYQLYRITSYSSASYYYMGNPSLTPETSDTFELGFKKQASKKLDFGMNLFVSNTKDAIVAVEYPAGSFPGAPDATRPVRAYTNVNDEKRYGTEWSIRYKFDKKFNVFANYTWQNGKYSSNTTSQLPIDEIPKHLLHLGINYNFKNWSATLDGTYVSQRNAGNTPTGIYYLSYDPYFIANFRVGYKVNEKVSFALSINNLFDREYYESYIAPGRSWFLEARVKL